MFLPIRIGYYGYNVRMSAKRRLADIRLPAEHLPVEGLRNSLVFDAPRTGRNGEPWSRPRERRRDPYARPDGTQGPGGTPRPPWPERQRAKRPMA
jgi:hypothetical protein